MRTETSVIQLVDEDGNQFSATLTRTWEVITTLTESEERERLPSIQLENGDYLKPHKEKEAFVNCNDESIVYYLT